MLYSIVIDYSHLEPHMNVALVPVKDLNVSEKYSIAGNITVYPKNSLNTEALQGGVLDFGFLEIKNTFYDAAIIAVPATSSQAAFTLGMMPGVKDELIKRILNKTEEIANIFRYIYFNFDGTSGLFQRAGYIEGNLCGFLLYSCAMQSSIFISGKNYISSRTISSSLSIDIAFMRPSIDYLFNAIYRNSTAVSNILKHAFRLYSDILYLPTSTGKFMQAMTLIDYLGNPFEYQKMQKNKTKIAPFSADSRQQYNHICERFKYLTSLKDENSKEIGLRTNIVHNGKSLEDLLFEGYKVNLVLRELQLYICNFINGILDFTDQNDWSSIEIKIQEKYNEIQAIPKGYEGKTECDAVIIIDFDFLNDAIREVYQLYPNYRNKKFDIALFLQLVLKQTDISRPDYQIPVNFVYSKDTVVYNAASEIRLSQYNGLGFQCPDGEISIYTLYTANQHSGNLEILLRNCIQEKNYCYNDAAKYTHIVFISDYNQIADDLYMKAINSYKSLILGRLDSQRTKCFGNCTYFDIENLIMTALGIPLHEECTADFFFTETGRYPDA